MPADDLESFEVFRRGVDARKPQAILFVYTIDVQVRDEAKVLARLNTDRRVSVAPDMGYKFVARVQEKMAHGGATVHSSAAAHNGAPRPIVIGMGPAGLFAALILAQSGFRPLVLERGKAVRERTVDTFRMWRQGVLDTESNTQFGEGGAGTFSDGKLYSQIKDPKHYGRKVLREFVAAGAPEEILYVSKPHIERSALWVWWKKCAPRLLSWEVRFVLAAAWKKLKFSAIQMARALKIFLWLARIFLQAKQMAQTKLAACARLFLLAASELPATTLCLRLATARAIRLPCFTRAACSYRLNRFLLVFA